MERGPIQDVNIELGDDVSRMLYEAAKLTQENRPGLLVEFHESFSGARAMTMGGINDPENMLFNLGFDGVGTKVEVAERLRNHSYVAHDLFAMVCDDAVVRGAEPVAIGSILDVRQLDDNDYTRESVRQLGEGYVAAAKEANVIVVNGEVAELGKRIGGYKLIDGYSPPRALFVRLRNMITGRKFEDFNYNWGAAVVWLAHKDRILTGHQIQPGDSLVGFAEHGFRSNGLTDVRIAMRKEYGRRWHEEVVSNLGSLSLGELVQKPSIIYSRLVSELTGGSDIEKDPKANVTGVAHITGGGQPSKLGRMLDPSGLGAVIYDPLDPPPIMLEVQRLRGFSDETAYRKWHMGPGMVVSTPEPDKVIAVARESGIDAQLIGEIRDMPGICIRNRGAVRESDWLDF